MSSNYSSKHKRRRKLWLVLPPTAAAASALAAGLIWNWSLPANWKLPTQLAALDDYYQDTQRPWTPTARHMPLPKPVSISSSPDVVVDSASTVDAALLTPETQSDGLVLSDEPNVRDNGSPAGTFTTIDTDSGRNAPSVVFSQSFGGLRGGSGSAGPQPLQRFASNPMGGDFSSGIGGGSSGGSGDNPVKHSNDPGPGGSDNSGLKKTTGRECEAPTDQQGIDTLNDSTGECQDKESNESSSSGTGGTGTGGTGTGGSGTGGSGGDGTGDQGDGNGGDDGTCIASFRTTDGVTAANSLSTDCQQSTSDPTEGNQKDDSQQVVAIPEPGSLALFLVGLAGLAAVRRRKA